MLSIIQHNAAAIALGLAVIGVSAGFTFTYQASKNDLQRVKTPPFAPDASFDTKPTRISVGDAVDRFEIWFEDGKMAAQCIGDCNQAAITFFNVILKNIADNYLERHLPSPLDIQRRLNQIEPQNPVVVDGVIGKETMKKWNRVYNNQQGIKSVREAK